MRRRCWSWLFLLALAAGCPSRDLPPPPPDEPKLDKPPACGKVYGDVKVPGGTGCCYQQTAGLLKSADVAAACGVPEASYLGQTRDGDSCRLYFQKPGVAPSETFVLVSRPVIPAGKPAPIAPNPMLVWTWKKIPLRDALGYQAVATGRERGLLEHHEMLWAGRGRRIVGLQVSKELCEPGAAEALLQKAIDAVP
jgi:hypothetical protein